MSKSVMFRKIVPVAIVALTAFAAAGAASAHDVIVPRAGFDEASASRQTASNAQSPSQSESKIRAQNGASASANNQNGSTNVQVLDPAAIPDGWWKDQ